MQSLGYQPFYDRQSFAVSARFARQFNLSGHSMVCAKKPLEIIERELPDFECPELVAEDIVTALEDAGWHLVWSGSPVVPPTAPLQA